MKFHTCPDCGAALDFGEICDCQKNENDTALTTVPPSETTDRVPEIHADVKDCEILGDWLKATGAMHKDVALVLQNRFPLITRQLLSQCTHWERYGVILHPAGLETIAYEYGLDLTQKPRHSQKRRKTRQITFRCSEISYGEIADAKEALGLDTDQAFIETAIAALIKSVKKET